MDKTTVEKLLALVKRNYSAIATEFDATRRKELWPEIIRLAGAVPEGAEILDAGCGNGRLLEAFQDKAIKYFGFDNCPELVELAKQHYPNQTFGLGDLLDIRQVVGGRKYDYIFCLAVLPHIPGKELRRRVLQDLAAGLKPGGHLVMSVWNLRSNPKYRGLIFKSYWSKILGREKSDFNDLIFPWKDSAGAEGSLRYYHAFSLSELKREVAAAGLIIEEIKKDKYNYWLVAKNS